MDEPNAFPAVSEGGASRAAHGRFEAARRGFLRRLLALLAAGGTAFTLTTWTLVRWEAPLAPAAPAREPQGVVRAQLEALNRGELRAAYEQFSPKYRERVPFEAYHALVVTHRRMFRTRELRFSAQVDSGERAVLDTHILAEGGVRYVARFTLVRAEDRWWIDDLRWGAEPEGRKLVAV